MSAYIPNGSTLHMSALGTDSVVVSGISNAATAVVSAAAHGYANGDYVKLVSGWSSLTGRAFRVANVTAGTFELEGVNTTDTEKYPAGQGGGTATKTAGALLQIQQVLTPESEGGEIQYTEFQFLEDTTKRRLATGKSAQGLKFAVGFDAALPSFPALETADEDQKERVVVLTLPTGTRIVYLATVAFNPTPSLNIDNVMACQASLSFQGKPVRI